MKYKVQAVVQKFLLSKPVKINQEKSALTKAKEVKITRNNEKINDGMRAKERGMEEVI